MKLRGPSPEAAGYRAAAANAAMAVARAGAWCATGNDGFIVDFGHDISDVASISAKARAIETHGTDSEKSRLLRQRLRFGAAGLFLAGGLFGIHAGVSELSSGHTEDAGLLALSTAVATAGVSIEIARRTHRSLDATAHKHDGHNHASTHDLRLHVVGDGISSTVYALGLGAQATTDLPIYGSGAVLAAGVITTGFALKTLHGIVKHPD